MPLSLVALHRVRDEDSGVASSLLNTGQQVGGAIGLAALGTVTWTAVANSVRARSREPWPRRAGRATSGAGQSPASWYHDALAAGVTRGFLVAAGFALAALTISAIAIRVHAGQPASAEPVPTRPPVSSAALPGTER